MPYGGDSTQDLIYNYMGGHMDGAAFINFVSTRYLNMNYTNFIRIDNLSQSFNNL